MDKTYTDYLEFKEVTPEMMSLMWDVMHTKKQGMHLKILDPSKIPTMNKAINLGYMLILDGEKLYVTKKGTSIFSSLWELKKSIE